MPPVLLTISATCERLSLGRTKVKELVACGELESVKIDRSRRVVAESVDAYVERLRQAAA